MGLVYAWTEAFMAYYSSSCAVCICTIAIVFRYKEPERTQSIDGEIPSFEKY
jgi:hypothetical protein